MFHNVSNEKPNKANEPSFHAGLPLKIYKKGKADDDDGLPRFPFKPQATFVLRPDSSVHRGLSLDEINTSGETV